MIGRSAPKLSSDASCRFTTIESALACLVSLLLYWGYQKLAALVRWRRNRKRAQSQDPLLVKEVNIVFKAVFPSHVVLSG
jgi:hypothetical protein